MGLLLWRFLTSCCVLVRSHELQLHLGGLQGAQVTSADSCSIMSRHLHSLLLTPQRVPDFFVPPRGPRQGRTSPAPEVSLRLPGVLLPGRDSEDSEDQLDYDTDVTTRAAMSLMHVDKVATPYGFCAMLAASPCTRRRESLFHRHTRTKVQPAPAEDTSGVQGAPRESLQVRSTTGGSPAVRSAPRGSPRV
ncbi:C2 calcium-dependent domain-containing protein 4A-like [Nerophis ophidion]|uniref:C2 calcium-dependent domain-containing protein 4A-like n=1 Tax=Nerophis ophidion TaxID=159077 RepID=UPI002AE081A5|nr:C2 calcium-dependent domain-containing protein 4A-like [Nerophis ophidion]